MLKSRVLMIVLSLATTGTAALAEDIVLPSLVPAPHVRRPGYRHAHFPPPQYNLLGQRVRAPQPQDRPTYREAEQFPPPGGRYGGGFIEFVLTGGRPEPVAAAPAVAMPIAQREQVMPAAQPGAYVALAETAPGAAAERASLPKGGLPEIMPREFGTAAQ